MIHIIQDTCYVRVPYHVKLSTIEDSTELPKSLLSLLEPGSHRAEDGRAESGELRAKS